MLPRAWAQRTHGGVDPEMARMAVDVEEGGDSTVSHSASGVGPRAAREQGTHVESNCLTHPEGRGLSSSPVLIAGEWVEDVEGKERRRQVNFERGRRSTELTNRMNSLLRKVRKGERSVENQQRLNYTSPEQQCKRKRRSDPPARFPFSSCEHWHE